MNEPRLTHHNLLTDIFKQQYSDYVRACYPTWNKDRQVKNIHRVKKINNQINEIEKRRRDAEESFTQELEMREMLSKKVIKKVIKSHVSIETRVLLGSTKRTQRGVTS